MSSRAKRICDPGTVVAFPWSRIRPSPHASAASAAADGSALQAQLAAVEREAFARGLAQGEAAAAAAAGERAEAILRRLTDALQDVVTHRADMMRRSERQLVELALTLARRIVHRELSTHADLVLSMARVALDRVEDGARVTVRLNPADYDAAGGASMPQLGTSVTVVADPKVEAGGCRIESELGTLDAGADAQIHEFGRALLGDDAQLLGNVA